LFAASVKAGSNRHSIWKGKDDAHDVFYSSNLKATLTPTINKEGEFEWHMPEAELQNVGFAKHFNPIALNRGEEHVFKMGWNSWGRYTEDCPHKKVDNDYHFQYQCRDAKKGKLNKGCDQQVACHNDDGDFKIFIGDSHGRKISADNFGRLSDPKVTGPWKGIEWHIFPHAPVKKAHDGKEDSPTHVYTPGSSRSDFQIFSEFTNYRNIVPETCTQYYDGSFHIPQNKDVDFDITFEKVTSDTIYAKFQLGDVVKEFRKKYDNVNEMPIKIDTFAIAYPNERHFRYLKIWDEWGSGEGNDRETSWDHILKVSADEEPYLGPNPDEQEETNKMLAKEQKSQDKQKSEK